MLCESAVAFLGLVQESSARAVWASSHHCCAPLKCPLHHLANLAPGPGPHLACTRVTSETGQPSS